MLNKLSENVNKEKASIKQGHRNHSKEPVRIKNTICKMKNTLEGINSRFDEAEN